MAKSSFSDFWTFLKKYQAYERKSQEEAGAGKGVALFPSDIRDRFYKTAIRPKN
jgi:hypothetical protein